MICFCERNLKNDFELPFVTYIRIPFGHCHVSFPFKEILSFFGHCHVTFPYMELLSFFGRFEQKVIVSYFSYSIFRKRCNRKELQRMAAVMIQVIPSFYTIYSKNSPFISANTYEKYIVSKEYSIAHHDDNMCFLPNCRYHIILIGNIKELLQKLDAFCFNYQHVDCLYTLFKYRFSDKIVLKSGQVFDNLKRAIHLNQQNRGVDRMPSIAKKKLLRKKFKKHLLSSFRKTKLSQTSGSVFADRIKQAKRTKFELELIKIVDCFLVGHGNYTRNLVSIKIKSL